jgi:hypothetical protein
MSLIRLVISCCCLAGISTICQGQKFRDVSNLKTKYLKSEISQYEFGYKIPFRKIEVIDFRFDTSKIGYYMYRDREHHTKFVTPGGLQNFLNRQLNEYFKNNLDTSSSQTLVIVLKKLWLEYEMTSRMLRYKNINEEPVLNLANRNSVCLADIDVFCRTDTAYQALLRITCDFKINKGSDNSDSYLLLLPFDSVASKVRSIDVPGTLASRKKFSQDELSMNYRKRFEIPALLADSLNRGIFLSFDDFKKNRPVYPDFRFKTFEISTEVTVQHDGKEVPIIDYWGFSDGKQLYVKPGFLPFRVSRQGNTFDFLGCIGGKNVRMYVPTGTPVNIPVETTQMSVFPMQIDMETGKVY